MTVSILGAVVYCVKGCEYSHFSLFMIQAMAGCIQAAFSTPILVISLNNLCEWSCCYLSLKKEDENAQNLMNMLFNEYAQNEDFSPWKRKFLRENSERLKYYQNLEQLRKEEIMKKNNDVLEDDDIKNQIKEINQMFKLESPVREYIHDEI